VHSGQWLLYRYHPDRAEAGQNPLQLDSQAPRFPVSKYYQMENRFRMLSQTKPELARQLHAQGQKAVDRRFHLFQNLASSPPLPGEVKPKEAPIQAEAGAEDKAALQHATEE
jgi:pyruvate-ferredoxin/flavodoxin oxidoreductase